MKKASLILILSTSLALSSFVQAQGVRKRQGAPKKSSGLGNVIKNNQQKASSATPLSEMQRRLSEALTMARNGQYQQAAPLLYSLSKRSELSSEQMQIKYLLGVALSELKLYQTAAFQFVDVIRNGNSRYVRQAIERLSIAADALGDDTLLNYAISKVHVEDFPQAQKEVVYYRLGEIKMRAGQFKEAADLFAKVPFSSRYTLNARFNRGLALLEANRPQEALPVFQGVLRARSNASVTDTNRVAAQMAIARTYYQMQDWDKSMEAYRAIPRDSEFWHDALFESSWAELRAAKFRSTLSNLQSLHSPYYDDSYIPESLLVRSIVYLYICKFEETDKTLDLFEKQYGPVRRDLTQFLESNHDPLAYFAEAEKAYNIRKDKKSHSGMRIPYMTVRAVLDEGNVKRAFGYLRSLNDEKARIETMPNLSRSPLGVYAKKVLASRFRNSKVYTGDLVRAHLQNIKTDLNDFFEQASFVRYEMINGKKELLKKKIAGKDVHNNQIDDNVERVFYVQNGFQYWPFDGEYWLDEIGNYHYLGQQSCE